MPCHITDGPDYDDWLEQRSYVEPDEDAEYERHRQQEIDDEAFALEDSIKLLSASIEKAGEARLLFEILRIIQGKD